MPCSKWRDASRVQDCRIHVKKKRTSNKKQQILSSAKIIRNDLSDSQLRETLRRLSPDQDAARVQYPTRATALDGDHL